MRPLVLAPLLAACSTAPIPVTVLRAPQDEPGTYTVVGTATVDAAPDCLDLRATLAAEARRPSDATRLVRDQQVSVLSELASAGVAGSDVAVSALRLTPVRELVDPPRPASAATKPR